MKTSAVIRTVVAILLFGPVASCNLDRPVGPEGPVLLADVPGQYVAVIFDVAVPGAVSRILDLEEPGSLTMRLNANGSTTGRMFIPEGARRPGFPNGGPALDVSLEGTWSFDEGDREVDFDPDADLFLRDMTFFASKVGGGVRLLGRREFAADVEVTIIMDQQILAQTAGTAE